MERGEIRWYKFEQPNKRRPVVILTRSSAIRFLGEVTVAPITSTIRTVPTEVILDEKDGMKEVCTINLDHIQTVSKNKVGSFIAILSHAKLKQIKPALLFALGFD